MLTVLCAIGITAEGVTGALAAGRERMDLFGVVMVALITALGGGSIRDVLLGHYPLTWVRDPEFLLLVVAAAIVTVSIAGIMKYFRPLFLALDGLGLVVFSILGAQVALGEGHGVIIAVVAAVITGIAGASCVTCSATGFRWCCGRSSMPRSRSWRLCSMSVCCASGCSMPWRCWSPWWSARTADARGRLPLAAAGLPLRGLVLRQPQGVEEGGRQAAQATSEASRRDRGVNTLDAH